MSGSRGNKSTSAVLQREQCYLHAILGMMERPQKTSEHWHLDRAFLETTGQRQVLLVGSSLARNPE